MGPKSAKTISFYRRQSIGALTVDKKMPISSERNPRQHILF